MSTLLTTIILAFAIVVIAMLSLGVGWLFTGKSKIKSGMCGRLPSSKRDADCETESQCHLCHKDDEKK